MKFVSVTNSPAVSQVLDIGGAGAQHSEAEGLSSSASEGAPR
jgi:hypothetical protein